MRAELKRRTPEFMLRSYMLPFSKKPTVQAARKIWLHCVKHELDTPPDVLACFVQWVQKAHNTYEVEHKRSAELEEKEWKAVMRDLALVRFVKASMGYGKTQTAAIDDYVDKMGKLGVEVAFETARKRYNRMLKEYHQYPENE